MGDYNVAFKYNKRIITDNNQYQWPIPWNKYYLDRKMLNEDIAYATVDLKRKAADTDLMYDPDTRKRNPFLTR